MNLDAQDDRGSRPGFVRCQGGGTSILRPWATGCGAWKHRHGGDVLPPIVKMSADHFRVKVEPGRFPFRDLDEGQEQDDADWKNNDPRETVPSLHLIFRFPARGGPRGGNICEPTTETEVI